MPRDGTGSGVHAKGRWLRVICRDRRRRGGRPQAAHGARILGIERSIGPKVAVVVVGLSGAALGFSALGV